MSTMARMMKLVMMPEEKRDSTHSGRRHSCPWMERGEGPKVPVSQTFLALA